MTSKITRDDRAVVQGLLAGADFPSAPHIRRLLAAYDQAEARLASSIRLSVEDTEKLRDALLARRREDGEDFLVDAALALLDGRNEQR